ncbi:MAG: hypothetical protein ACLQDM_20865 [Bradyrhizobium sp.]
MPNARQKDPGLRTRFTRAKPPMAFATALGVLSTAIGVGVYWGCTSLAWTEPPPWVVTYVVSGVCFVLGGLLLVSVLFRLFVGIAPAVILELSEQPFPRGRRIRITVIQPGPVEWSAFSVKFECLEETYKWDQRAGGEGNERGEMFRTTLTSRVVQVHELLSPQPIQAQRGSDWRRTFECVLPDNSPITLKNDDDAVFWQVVVKGSKSVVSGFEDSYEVCVE